MKAKACNIQWVMMTSLTLMALAACGGSKESPAGGGSRYALASVVINADGERTTYVQTVDSPDDGPFTNADAIEAPGNGVVMTNGRDILIGLAESPEWVRYAVGQDGAISEAGRLNLSNTGASAIDYGNAIVDAETVVSVLSGPALAVVWNPKTMTIKGEIDLSSLVRDDWELEVWTTIAHDGLVYIPARYANWEQGAIFPGVSTTILDPRAMRVLGTATDDRCASGGKVVFDAKGYGYVMGDGRNDSIQMFANANGGTAPQNCLLRIAPGATSFDPDYYYAIPSLTGGLESITELDTADEDGGVAFAKVFYPDKLPPGVEPVDFTFWDQPAHKMWRIALGDTPVATEVAGAPFSAIGFGATAMGGRLFVGESPNPARSEVYEIDPATNVETHRFTMDGYFYGIFDLAGAHP